MSFNASQILGKHKQCKQSIIDRFGEIERGTQGHQSTIADTETYQKKNRGKSGFFKIK